MKEVGLGGGRGVGKRRGGEGEEGKEKEGSESRSHNNPIPNLLLFM